MAEVLTEGIPAVGWVVFQPIEVGEILTKGGVVVPACVRDSENNRLGMMSARYGLIVACGEPCDHQGRIFDLKFFKGWPLPAGTVIEYTRPNAWRMPDGRTLGCLAEDVRRWWLPGTRPAWISNGEANGNCTT